MWKILNAQPPDRRHHPAILVAMVVDAAHVADVPADGHDFEELAFVDQVPRVMALGVKKIRSQRLRTNRSRLRELQNTRNGELL
jgi:hypothetical protein